MEKDIWNTEIKLLSKQDKTGLLATLLAGCGIGLIFGAIYFAIF